MIFDFDWSKQTEIEIVTREKATIDERESLWPLFDRR